MTDFERAMTDFERIENLDIRDLTVFSANLAAQVHQWQTSSLFLSDRQPSASNMREFIRNAISLTILFRETMRGMAKENL